MKIELKNIKVLLANSEETTCFNADIYIDGKKTGYARNSGIGGPTEYYSYHKPNNDFDLREAEKFCEGLPALKVGNFEIPMNLEHYIDELLEQHLKAKEEKRIANKMQKDMLIGIVVETANGYSLVSWKGHTIASIKQHPQGKATLKAKILELQSKGEKILNTNLADI